MVVLLVRSVRARSARRPPLKPKRRKKRVARAEPPPAKIANGHGNAIEFARFGEYVVLRTADVIELLRVIERWRDMLEVKA